MQFSSIFIPGSPGDNTVSYFDINYYYSRRHLGYYSDLS